MLFRSIWRGGKRQRMDNYVKGVKVIEIYDAANKECFGDAGVRGNEKFAVPQICSDFRP